MRRKHEELTAEAARRTAPRPKFSGITIGRARIAHGLLIFLEDVYDFGIPLNRQKGEETIRSLLDGVKEAAKASSQAAYDAARNKG